MKMKVGPFEVLSARTFAVALAASALVAGTTSAFADAIPYPSKGTQILTNDVITATGGSTLTFYGLSAQDNDYIDVYDVTQGTQSGYIFDNQTTAVGTVVNMATNLHDVIVLEIIDESAGEVSYDYSQTTAPVGTYTCTGSSAACTGVPTTPPAPSEAVNHFYETTYSGSAVDGLPPGDTNSTPIPAGLFFGAEDRTAAENSDYDYNDDQFILTGVTQTAPPSVPEPGSIALLGTGILGAAGMVRRRLMMAR